jgi:hypothetical protein
MKQSQREFTKDTRLGRKSFDRYSRNIVDMAVRASYDIYTDHRPHAKYNRNNRLEPEGLAEL